MEIFQDVLLAADFDRTLTDRQSRIPQRNLEAIRAFEAEGGLFTVATGRSVPMFRAQQGRIPYNAPLILYNGGASYDFRTGTLTDPILLPDALEILRDLVRRYPQLRYEIQGVDYHYLLGEDPIRDAYYRDNDAPSTHFTLDDPPPDIMKIAIYGVFLDTTVAGFYRITPEEDALFTGLCADLTARWPKIVVDRSAPRIVDLQARSVNKGAAARALARRLGRKLLVCVGDSFNDVTMLQEGDLSFVPADADARIRAMGFGVVCSCDEGAVAGAIDCLRRKLT